MTDIQKRLFELKDDKNALFQAKLTPGIPVEKFLGVRIPAIRKLAKEIQNLPETEVFLDTLPHEFYDENILHSVLLSNFKDYEKCLEKVEAFLPFIDNWAVSDGLRPKIFLKNKDSALEHAKKWMKSDKTYTIRFGVSVLLNYFLDDYFCPEILEIPLEIKSEEYYVNMMIAWFYATALAKHWKETVPVIEQHRLGEWTHRKTIQKAKESFRITEEQKEYLKRFLR